MNNKTVQENEVFNILESILLEKNEEKYNILLDNLNSFISSHFENNNSIVLEKIISKLLEEKNEDAINLLMEEIHFEIENVLYVDKDEDYDSTMLLMPICIISQKETITLPSIEKIEKIVVNKLLKNKLIDNKQNFKLGTFRLTDSELNNMSLQNWWNTHRNIIDEDELTGDKEKNLKNIRSEVLQYKPEQDVSMLYFVATVSNKDNNSEFVEKLYDSYLDIDLWNSIGDDLFKESKNSAKFTVFPPMNIVESIENIENVIQEIKFDLFFDEYVEQEDIQIGYIKLADMDNVYALLFFNQETNLLHQYYLYKTNNDPGNFISHLIERTIEHPNVGLYRFDIEIKSETLNSWATTKQEVDISNLLDKSFLVDTFTSYKISQSSNPNFNDPKAKITIH